MSNSIKEPFFFGDATNGVIDDLAVADSLMPKNAVRFSLNCMFDRPRGAVSQRLGTTILGDDLGSQIYGLHNHRSSTASNNKLIGVSGNAVKYLSGATWMTSSSMGTTAK